MPTNETQLTFNEKVATVQEKMKVPKDRTGYGYAYRNLDDILITAKPLLLEQGLTISFRDEVNYKGDKYFMKSICEITDGENVHQGQAEFELLDIPISDAGKETMNKAQSSGATASYVRKYAAQGTLGIDDEDEKSDADHKSWQSQGSQSAPKKASKPRQGQKPTTPGKISEAQLRLIGVLEKKIQEAAPQLFDGAVSWYNDTYGEATPKDALSVKQGIEFIDHLKALEEMTK